MDRSRCSNRLMTAAAAALFLFAACENRFSGYYGTALSADHHWLKDKKIFVDPGHGGGDPRDRYRTGPNGVSEPELNLKVAVILADMLNAAGAKVELSRTGSSGDPDHERARKARQWKPDLLVSIHHGSSLRSADNVNYPTVMIWGSREIQPASFDFALDLIDEFNKIMDEKGIIVSDFTLYRVGGATILRETSHLCPGIIGEAGFYTNIKHSIRLKDRLYLEKEAEAYFYAISRYFKRGTPSAEVHFSCPVSNSGFSVNLISCDTPIMTIRALSGNDFRGINEKSLRISLDGIAVGHRRISEDLFEVNYGRFLYPGFHRLKFQFRNLQEQSSMILTAPFTVEVRPGDYKRLVSEGKKLVSSRRSVREGIKMLLSALSLGHAEPGNEKIMLDIARGFARIGDRSSAEYYTNRFHLMYPSRTTTSDRENFSAQNNFRVPLEYLGKQVHVVQKTCSRGKDERRIKNKFSALKINFFLDKKKLI
ncbi:MAG TPA: N-acetylmuramoyl-L-alanine amidase [Spirochaetota bacterium]|nr:N-acetylmuramoyl-L-alanine amidase [Spirochaetota bacterium]HQJ72239.1 N-acetylmuramoyl-L-alanine amidase [Spirochaetota bacterium]HRS77033.1 N-acetylmuramoyl-L-alanine amidase [Spirochaetota bacterium]HRT74819.1 N-acetylmuramoyl-L-alanine amidase [Spirochaetota bacterium]